MQVTPRCQQAIAYARSAESRFGQGYFSDAHLILGLLSVDSLATQVLKEAGVTVDGMERYLQSHSFDVEQTTRKAGRIVDRSAFNAMARAEGHAKSTGCQYVGTEHVLLALLDEQQGDASDVFDANKIDRETMRRSLIKRLKPWVVIGWPAVNGDE